MSRSSQRFVLLACAGVASALLGMAGLAVAGLFGPGLAFGIAVALVFRQHAGVRSPLRLLGFIAASTAALPISGYSALWATPWANNLLPGLSSEGTSDVPLPAIFLAGAIGAFIIFLSAFLLLIPANVRLQGIVRPVLLALGGGVLGVIGWVIAKSVPLYLIWQTGVALCIPLVAPAEEDQLTRQPARRSLALQLITGLLLTAILAFLGWQIFEIVRVQRNAGRQHAQLRRMIQEAPPLEGLRPLQALPCDQEVIKENLGGYFVHRPLTMQIPGRPAGIGFFRWPAYVDCTLQYSRTEAITFGFRGATVSIQEYPNQAWARYMAKYPSATSGIPNSLTVVRKFSNRVYTDATLRSANGGTLFFSWPSSTNAVTVRYNVATASTNEELLRRYLAKYPSSL